MIMEYTRTGQDSHSLIARVCTTNNNFKSKNVRKWEYEWKDIFCPEFLMRWSFVQSRLEEERWDLKADQETRLLFPSSAHFKMLLLFPFDGLKSKIFISYRSLREAIPHWHHGAQKGRERLQGMRKLPPFTSTLYSRHLASSDFSLETHAPINAG